MPSDPEIVLGFLSNVFERLSVPYVVGGSIASSVYGIPRATQDVDILAVLEAEHVSLFFESLKEKFYIDKERVQDAVAAHGSFSVIHLDTMLKAVIFEAGLEPWTREELRRKKRQSLSESSAFFIDLSSPEDNILHKLRWFRMGGDVSDKQWNDVLSVLKVQGSRLDYVYLRKWAHTLGLEALLDRALLEAASAGSSK